MAPKFLENMSTPDSDECQKINKGLNTAFMKQTITLEAESYSAGQNTFSIYVGPRRWGPRFHRHFDTHLPNHMLS